MFIIIGLTGYPLFLTFSTEDHVDEIKFVDLELFKENFVKEAYEQSGENKSLLKMLNFWKDIECVNIPLIEEIYENYLDVQDYRVIDEINFINIISKDTFKLVHEDTGEVLGTFNEFSLDKVFKVIDPDFGEFKLSEGELEDLLIGKYDFVLDN